MRNKVVFIFVIWILLPTAALSAEQSGGGSEKTLSFAGLDLHLSGQEVISYQLSTGVHVLVFENRSSMSMGTNRFSSDRAVVWLRVPILQKDRKTGPLKAGPTESRGRARYETQAYLQGNVSVKKGRGAATTDLRQTAVEDGQAIVVRFGVSGAVFVTADKREIADPRRLELYTKAVSAISPVEAEPAVEPVPEPPMENPLKKPSEKVVAERKGGSRTAPTFRYPVNISPAGEVPLNIEQIPDANRTYITTVIGRFYLWQKQEKGGLLELQADNAVIWYSKEALKADEESRRAGGAEDFLAGGDVRAIYMSGDVVMTRGQRTIRADEMYYDFEEEKGLALNGEMRNFDVRRGIPIYVRAAKLRQLAANKFGAEDATVTSSEFYVPQLSANASSVIITDTTPVDEQAGTVSDSSYDAQMRDFRLKLDDKTIFYWPYIRSNLERSDIPLKRIHAGHDSDWGMFVETRWYLARLLGLQEPEGTDSTLALDYYGKRGVGGGAEISYAKDDYWGRILGYVIRDTGDDDLGRYYERRNLKPPRKLRGRFLWQHRHFLPYNWQLSSEVSYASDENFIEGFYRSEYNIGKEQETLVHLKRIEDNWGLSLLSKWRINDFVDKLEELPSVEYHLTGQSLLDDRLTFYSDTQASRWRQRFASSSSTGSEEFFTFMSERAELDMPVTVGKVRVVPFVAGTVGYEDGSGFFRKTGGAAGSREEQVWFGEAGARVSTQYWKVYPNVKSRLWDLNQLRHIIRPNFTAVGYTESDSVVEQRDILNVGISQRLQTRRGPAGKQRTVDWMRLDTDVTWVRDCGDASAGPDRFIWNKPFIPMRDRRSSDTFGPRRDYFGADYIWRVSDTTAVLSDMNYDIRSGVVQQFNIGFSRLRRPNLSYYVGSRYLRRINVLGEQGSNMFTFAATYVMDPRYTVVFSQQFDFDYDKSIRSDITLIRRYHRLYCAFTFSADETLRKQGIVFSIWPQGVQELAFGPGRYMGLGGSPGY